jgi:phosphopantothenoylcysteine decarboxylase / phosphopantothenate---cysteine ligase
MKKLLLIISGSIAATKVPALIGLLKERGIQTTCILTKAGSNFVKPEELGAEVQTDLFSENKDSWMEHINLSRTNDLLAVIPASADIIARIAAGRADDLAAATILASDKPVYIAPAMNTKMWENPATQNNIKTLIKNGIRIIEPESGMLACGEEGLGRLANIETLAEEILGFWSRPLKGVRAVITAGSTYEPIDPIRFIGNRSTGLQGYYIAESLRDAGADVILIRGAVSLPDPYGIKIIKAETAEKMLAASLAALPADIFIASAAVSDWRVENSSEQKLKKRDSEEPPVLKLVQNPDILKTVATCSSRPKLVIGFAAETENLEDNAQTKLQKKNADWIIANIISSSSGFGEVENEILYITKSEHETWPASSKKQIALNVVKKIISLSLHEK